MPKWVYTFGNGSAEGTAEMKYLLGGKGANLAEMSNLQLPVPPGFTITTEVCTTYFENERTYPDDLKSEVEEAIGSIGNIVGRTFGDITSPLLLSVRSGSRASMPGMMDTVLNLGLNDETVKGLAELSGDERFAYDSYRRFIQMYSNVVLEVDHHRFEDILDEYKEVQGQNLDTELGAEDWKEIVRRYKTCIEEEIEKPFPQDVSDQIWGAVSAVFGSWQNMRAQTYRRLHNIPDDWGTAVNVQAMVFGNMGEDSATGVAFTRNPSTGEGTFFGEYLINAQGEDVVAGIRTPQQVTIAGKQEQQSKHPALEEVMPRVFGELCEAYKQLEVHYRDMQDIEFTVERGKLWMLQTRDGKRTAKAALKIAVDMANEGIISEQEAILRVDPAALDQLLHPTLDPQAERNVIAKGLPASPGAASGEVVFSADEAESQSASGKQVILVRTETSPEDIHGMHAAEGILTTRGGMTSHAAVVARGMGRPCVSGAGTVRIDYNAESFSSLGKVVKAGDWITIDGTSGEIMLGQIPTLQPELSGDFGILMTWADKVRRLKIRANSDTPEDTRTARQFGAEGIGLCRTEHMFFDEERIVTVREMILAQDEAGRRTALEKLLPMQRQDFTDLFEIMHGLPVTIRLLDPPLHEFLPHTSDELDEVAKAIGVSSNEIKARANELQEVNPMLGHRGCRLGISHPEIYETQARAVFEASIEAATKTNEAVTPEIMIPLVADRKELEFLKARIIAVARDVEKETGKKLEFLIGTMIELPRAAIQAGDIAEAAEFFSFGTNDLTQTVYGISRDDSAHFMNDYLIRGIWKQDPFVSLDQQGVGALVSMAAENGRKSRPDLKLGICGEHGGDPASIEFCNRQALDYVSCSPYRVPIARLAAAQAAIRQADEDDPTLPGA